jgi:hypothetical protein
MQLPSAATTGGSHLSGVLFVSTLQQQIEVPVLQDGVAH